MNNTIASFLLRIFFFSGVLFGLHLLVLNFAELPLFGDKIVLSYAINVFLAIVVFIALFLLKERFKNQLGFIFILGSLMKFVLFFILFQPAYKADNVISTSEFFAFFAPYILTLVVEIISLSKWLKQMDELPS